MKKIALEEAFAVKSVEKCTLREFRQNEIKLIDLADMRIRAMDEGEVGISVVSATSSSIQGLADYKIEVETPGFGTIMWQRPSSRTRTACVPSHVCLCGNRILPSKS